MTVFYDFLECYQDYDFRLPIVGDRVFIEVDTITAEHKMTRQPNFQYKGSHSTSITIGISGNRIRVTKGNPSRVDRLDNLFGFTTLSDCVAVYNKILLSYGLPPFTPCTKIYRHSGEDGSRVITSSDGLILTRVDVTSNQRVGRDNVDDYIKGFATQKFKNTTADLKVNGKTVQYKNSLIKSSVYDKGHEIAFHLLPVMKRKYGVESKEFKYVKRLIEFCNEQGVARFEMQLLSALLRREGLNFYGLFDENKLKIHLNELLKVDKKLQVIAMTYESISERLLALKIVDSAYSANTTASYALRWMHGERFDLSKTQVQMHRSRLRKMGIEIANVCDVTTFSPMYVTSRREVIRDPLQAPNWYQHAFINHLAKVA